jgi:spore coat protein U-like protein
VQTRLNKGAVAALILCGLAWGKPAIAGNCSFVRTPAAINFGSYSPFSTVPVDANTTFEVRCSAWTTAKIVILQGSSAPSFDPRLMQHTVSPGPDFVLPYNLYVDPAATQIWGDGAGAGTTFYVDYNATNQTKTFTATIYGRIPAGFDAASGSFADSVTVHLYGDDRLNATAALPVSASVPSECRVDTFTIAFGAYDPIVAHASHPADAEGAVRVYCTRGTSGVVTLSSGSNLSGGTRRMAGPGGDFLAYQIFSDLARNVIWDTTNGVSGTSTSPLEPIGGSGGLPAYGRIAPGQNVREGDYTDTITATVNY